MFAKYEISVLGDNIYTGGFGDKVVIAKVNQNAYSFVSTR